MQVSGAGAAAFIMPDVSKRLFSGTRADTAR